jgi:acyl-CoA synthetase (AMP-forming)/AMP-acid ligase II
MAFRTIPQAIEDAAKAEPRRGLCFVHESGVQGFPAPLPPASGALVGPSSQAARADVSSPETVLSYADVERLSARFGGALQALGLRKGDRVALILPNNDDFVLAFFGAIRAGIIPAPI